MASEDGFHGSGGHSPLPSRNSHLNNSGPSGNEDSGDGRNDDEGDDEDIPFVVLPQDMFEVVDHPKNESGSFARCINRQRCRDDIRKGTKLICFKGKQCFTAMGDVVGDTVQVKFPATLRGKGATPTLVKSKIHVGNIVAIQNCIWCSEVLSGSMQFKNGRTFVSYLQCLNDGCPRRVCLPSKTHCLEQESQRYPATKFFWENQRRGVVCSDCSDDSYSDQFGDTSYASFKRELESRINRVSQESRAKGGCVDEDVSSTSSDGDEPPKKKSTRKVVPKLAAAADLSINLQDVTSVIMFKIN